MHDENHYMSRCQAPKKLKHLDGCHRTTQFTYAKVELPEDYHLVNSEKGKTGLILFSAFFFQNGNLGPVGAMVSLQQPSLHKEYKTWKKAVRSSAGSTPLILEPEARKMRTTATGHCGRYRTRVLSTHTSGLWEQHGRGLAQPWAASVAARTPAAWDATCSVVLSP